MCHKYRFTMLGIASIVVCLSVKADQLSSSLQRLKHAYPNTIRAVSADYITWHDGERMPVHTSTGISLADQLKQPAYSTGREVCRSHKKDPGRIRYEPFFRKMYGNTPEEVERSLETVDWMPAIFGTGTYPLLVTCVNGVSNKVRQISQELEALVQRRPEYLVFLENPGGSYRWRTIANTQQLSAHSFGIALDINTRLVPYWQWDLKKEKRPVLETERLSSYHDQSFVLPWEIVEIFEKQGFIWGGKWYHYDAMHFEYRPELFIDPSNNVSFPCRELLPARISKLIE